MIDGERKGEWGLWRSHRTLSFFVEGRQAVDVVSILSVCFINKSTPWLRSLTASAPKREYAGPSDRQTFIRCKQWSPGTFVCCPCSICVHACVWLAGTEMFHTNDFCLVWVSLSLWVFGFVPCMERSLCGMLWTFLCSYI